MSTVYLANDLKLKGKRWALKETSGRLEDFDLFVKEAEVLIRLNHPFLPNIVDYYGPDTEGIAYLVMDYIAGQTLQQIFLKQMKRIRPAQMINYAIQLCHLFDYLHKQRPQPVIYRDLKPDNVMIDEYDQVRLIDFGIARSYKTGQSNDTVRLGTVGFAAPEQYMGQQTDPRTDLFALGAMMYYLLSGGTYFSLERSGRDSFPKESPKGLINIVNKLVQFQPEDRYQNASEVMRDLQNVQHSEKAHYGKETLRTESIHNTSRQWQHVDSQLKEGRRSVIAPQLIIIGSLYPGAGSTFAGISLARVLHSYNIRVAYVENPTNQPELYALLFGDKFAPRKYQFITERIARNESVDGLVPWSEGFTNWYPLSPDGHHESWNVENSLTLLQSIREPIVIMDISGQWADRHVQELCQNANRIIAVTDTSPSKVYQPASQVVIRQLLSFKEQGRSIELIANKDIALKERKQWLHSQFIRPLCTLPYIDYSQVIEAQWRGKLVHDLPHVLQHIRKAYQPLIASLIN